MADHKQQPKTLEPDADALEQWQKLPQNKPSPQAFAPATGGMKWAWWLVALGAGAVILALLLNGFT